MWIGRNTRSISLQAQGGGLSLTSSAERPCPCAQLKSSNTRKAYSQSDSLKCRYGMMSAPSGRTIPNAPECSQTFANTPMNLSLPAAFRAKTFLALERAREYAEKEVAYGPSMRVSFAKFDPDSYSWKIPHFLFQEDWASFSQTWPRWGMMRHGVCYRLNQWEPDTSETESGSPRGDMAEFPTPTVNGNNNRAELSPKSGDGLNTAVRKLESWPTPQSHDAKSGMVGSHGWDRRGVGAQKNLNDMVLRYPSPCATDHKGAGKTGTPRDRLDYAIERGETKSHMYPTPNIDSMCGGSGSYAQIMQNPNLTDEEKRSMASGNAGQLNPDWVEWLMFWPVGWSDIETPNGELVWLHPTFDPADRERFRLPRLTVRRQHRANRVKAIGNGQYPATAWAAFEWGFAVLQMFERKELT